MRASEAAEIVALRIMVARLMARHAAEAVDPRAWIDGEKKSLHFLASAAMGPSEPEQASTLLSETIDAMDFVAETAWKLTPQGADGGELRSRPLVIDPD